MLPFCSKLVRRLRTLTTQDKTPTPWERTHPFDRKYGTDTSGFIPAEKLVSDQTLRSQITSYAGSQPAIIRSSLSAIDNRSEYKFIDIGCGKGRAMAVAAEFEFQRITGIEISPRLAKIARRNLAKVVRRRSACPPFTVIEGNAINFLLPKDKLVLFLYHPFGPTLVEKLIGNIERHLSSGGDHIFIVYYNPVFGTLFDASAAFTRWYANVTSYDQSELGFGPDTDDTVVIWQSVRGSITTPHSDVDRRLVVKFPWRAELA